MVQRKQAAAADEGAEAESAKGKGGNR
jgi:hypothetical protein